MGTGTFCVWLLSKELTPQFTQYQHVAGSLEKGKRDLLTYIFQGIKRSTHSEVPHIFYMYKCILWFSKVILYKKKLNQLIFWLSFCTHNGKFSILFESSSGISSISLLLFFFFLFDHCREKNLQILTVANPSSSFIYPLLKRGSRELKPFARCLSDLHLGWTWCLERPQPLSLPCSQGKIPEINTTWSCYGCCCAMATGLGFTAFWLDIFW